MPNINIAIFKIVCMHSKISVERYKLVISVVLVLIKFI